METKIIENGYVYDVNYYNEEKTEYHKVMFDCEYKVIVEADNTESFVNQPINFTLRKERFDEVSQSYIVDESFNGEVVLKIDPLDYPVTFVNGVGSIAITIDSAGAYDVKMDSENFHMQVNVANTFK